MKRLIGKMTGILNSVKIPKIPVSARQLTVYVLLVMVTVASCCSFVWSSMKTVTIAESEKESFEVRTFRKDVGDILQRQGIVLNENDKMNVTSETLLADNMTIEIYRAIPVTVTSMGETKSYMTTKRKVGEIFEELGFSANEKDIVTPNLAAVVSDGANLTLVKTAEEIVTTEEEIPFEVKEKINKNMSSGETKVAQAGQNGIKRNSYQITYQDGVEVSRELVGEEILVEAVDEVKEVGAKVSASSFQIASAGTLPSRGGSLSYSKVLQCNATAYDLSYESCGKYPGQPGYGRTASGMQAQYGVVAVDPRVIPLGTRLYIEAVDGSWTYGYAVAGDTGGAIKGNKIDLFFNTAAEVRRFGRRQAKVYILN